MLCHLSDIERKMERLWCVKFDNSINFKRLIYFKMQDCHSENYRIRFFEDMHGNDSAMS